MSLVMAAVCTDGIVVSGDFRRSRVTIDPETGIEKFEKYDDQHKLILTKSNRIIGCTGRVFLEDGGPTQDAIKDVLTATEDLNLSMYEEFEHLVACLRDENVAIIEAGVLDGKYTILVWKHGDTEISIDYTGGAIGATEFLKEHKERFESDKAGLETKKVANILRLYNLLTAASNKTVSSGCEIFTIK